MFYPTEVGQNWDFCEILISVNIPQIKSHVNSLNKNARQKTSASPRRFRNSVQKLKKRRLKSSRNNQRSGGIWKVPVCSGNHYVYRQSNVRRVNLPKPFEQPYQVLVALRFFSTGSSYITIWDMLLVSKRFHRKGCASGDRSSLQSSNSFDCLGEMR